ncbi:MAG: hypothetical protein QI199_04445, partial [Candidatus Korarchaeota archaeon]|nr:hypothetical protein [Candidatus Korarchaeota archaeon]
PISREDAEKAIETAREILHLLSAGPALIRGDPGGWHVDIPVMYQGYALDRIHLDVDKMEPSPKGRPVRSSREMDPSEIKGRAEEIVRELRVLDAAEYREPDRCWVVPLAWGPYLVAHVRVSSDGREVVPHYGLTEEVRRNVY